MQISSHQLFSKRFQTEVYEYHSNCSSRHRTFVWKKIIDEDGDLILITNEFDEKLLKNSGLLSTKPKLYVCNVDEESIKSGNKYTEDFIKKFDEKNTLVISADIENQINQLEDENEKKNYMKMRQIY